MSGENITHALVLAAGFGHRMRPLTEAMPKPLVRLGDKALIDHVLDRLNEAGVHDAVVNVHYLAGLIEAHLRARAKPCITISDERDELLDTGGAVKKALASLGDRAFFVHNSDSVWIERGGSTLARMIAAWDPETMDSLLLLAANIETLGYSGQGDFHLEADGKVRRRASDESAPYVFAGVSINHPRLFNDAPDGAFSLNQIWNRAIETGRLGAIVHDGVWMHVGTPGALAEAERLFDGLHAA